MEGTCVLTVNGKRFDLGSASWEIERPITVRIQPPPPPSFSWSWTIPMKRRPWLRLLRRLPKKRTRPFRGRAGEAFRRRQEYRAFLVVIAAARAGAGRVFTSKRHGAGT